MADDISEVSNAYLLQMAGSADPNMHGMVQMTSLASLFEMNSLPQILAILENSENVDQNFVELAVFGLSKIFARENLLLFDDNVKAEDYCSRCYQFMLKYENFSHIFANIIVDFFVFQNIATRYFEPMHQYLQKMYQTLNSNSTPSMFDRFVELLWKLTFHYPVISPSDVKDQYYQQFQGLVLLALREIKNLYFSSILLNTLKELNFMYESQIFTIQQPFIQLIIGFMMNEDQIRSIRDKPYSFKYLGSITKFLLSLYTKVNENEEINQPEIENKKVTTSIILEVIPPFLRILTQMLPSNISELEDTAINLFDIIIANFNELIELDFLTKKEGYFTTLADLCYLFSYIDNDTIINYEYNVKKYYLSLYHPGYSVRHIAIELLNALCQTKNPIITQYVVGKVISQMNEQSFLILSVIMEAIFYDDSSFQQIRLYVRDVLSNFDTYESRQQYTIIHMISNCLCALDWRNQSQNIFNIILDLFTPVINANSQNLEITPVHRFQFTMGAILAYKCLYVMNDLPDNLVMLLAQYANQSFSAISYRALELYLSQHQGMLIEVRQMLILYCLNDILNAPQSDQIEEVNNEIQELHTRFIFIKSQTRNQFPDFMTNSILDVFDSILDTEIFQEIFPATIAQICQNLILSNATGADRVFAYVVKAIQHQELACFQYDFSLPILTYISMYPESFRNNENSQILLRHIIGVLHNLVQSIETITEAAYWLDYSANFELLSKILEIMGKSLPRALIEQIYNEILGIYDDLNAGNLYQSFQYNDIIQYLLFQIIASLFAFADDFSMDETKFVVDILPNWINLIQQGLIKHNFYRTLHYSALKRIHTKLINSEDMNLINYAAQIIQVVEGLRLDAYSHDSEVIKDFFSKYHCFEAFQNLHTITRRQ